MFRRISNALAGRSRISLTQLGNLEDVLKVVSQNPDAQMKVSLRKGWNIYEAEATAEQTEKLLRENFEEDKHSVTDGVHEVYTGKGSQKHYLKVRSCRVKAVIGDTRFIGEPYRNARISFVA